MHGRGKHAWMSTVWIFDAAFNWMCVDGKLVVSDCTLLDAVVSML